MTRRFVGRKLTTWAAIEFYAVVEHVEIGVFPVVIFTQPTVRQIKVDQQRVLLRVLRSI